MPTRQSDEPGRSVARAGQRAEYAAARSGSTARMEPSGANGRPPAAEQVISEQGMQLPEKAACSRWP